MWMILLITGRLVKSIGRVLLVGWTPKPPPDFEARLTAVEHKAEATRQKVYRETKSGETDVVAQDNGQRHDIPAPVGIKTGDLAR